MDELPGIPVEATGPGTIDQPENMADIDLDGDDARQHCTQRPTYTMSDPEDVALVKRWFLSGPDAGRFMIGNTGDTGTIGNDHW